MTLQRKLAQWRKCNPEEMAKMSPVAIQHALADAKADIITMARLLCQAGYPRRNTEEETQDIVFFAEKVHALIPYADAVELA